MSVQEESAFLVGMIATKESYLFDPLWPKCLSIQGPNCNLRQHYEVREGKPNNLEMLIKVLKNLLEKDVCTNFNESSCEKIEKT